MNQHKQAKKGFEDLLFLDKNDVSAKKYLRKMEIAEIQKIKIVIGDSTLVRKTYQKVAALK